MGSPSALTDSGATTFPQTEEAATELYLGASAGLDALMEDINLTGSLKGLRGGKLRLNTRAPSFSLKAAERSARATDSDSGTIDWSGSVGGGTLTVKGTYSWSETGPDEGWTPTQNTTYNNLYADTFSESITGTLSGITTGEDLEGFTYTISGKFVENWSSDFNYDYKFGTEDWTVDVDASVNMAMGYAYSIRRSDGLGCKILITYAFANAKNDMNPETDNPYILLVGDTKANVKVYDDSDKLLIEFEVNIADFAEEDEEA
jgi:hypothetical protein